MHLETYFEVKHEYPNNTVDGEAKHRRRQPTVSVMIPPGTSNGTKPTPSRSTVSRDYHYARMAVLSVVSVCPCSGVAVIKRVDSVV